MLVVYGEDLLLEPRAATTGPRTLEPGHHSWRKPAFTRKGNGTVKTYREIAVAKAEGKEPMKHGFVNAPVSPLSSSQSQNAASISVPLPSTTSSWRNFQLILFLSLKTKLTFSFKHRSPNFTYFLKTLANIIFNCILVSPTFLYSFEIHDKTLII